MAQMENVQAIVDTVDGSGLVRVEYERTASHSEDDYNSTM